MTNPDSDPHYKKSVHAMIESQTYNPEAKEVSPKESIGITDGGKGEVLMESYRKDVSRPGEVRKAIDIEIGD